LKGCFEFGVKTRANAPARKLAFTTPRTEHCGQWKPMSSNKKDSRMSLEKPGFWSRNAPLIISSLAMIGTMINAFVAANSFKVNREAYPIKPGESENDSLFAIAATLQLGC
jgi:hypothetical protein